MPFALSVHNFINSVGADAGFASVIGLAVLILLYFAHARDAASLRDEAATLSQRLAEAEARLAQAQRDQGGPAPEPSPATGPRVPAAPAGVAAPALAAATRFIPVRVSGPAVAAAARAPGSATARATPASASGGAPGPTSTAAPAPAPTPAPSPSPAAAPGPAATPSPAVSSAPATTTPPVPARAAPDAPVPVAAPAVVAGSAHAAPVAAAPVTTLSRPAPATVAGGANGAAGASSGGVAPPGRLPDAPSRPGGGAPPRRPTTADFRWAPTFLPGTAGRDGQAWRRFGLLVGVLIVVAAAAAVVILTTGTGTQRPSSSTPASNAPIPGGVFKPSHVTVAVLNGTATNQLAHHVAAGLAAQGYKEGTIATASNQTETTTQVAYLPGRRANRTDALHVARALHLRLAVVGPIAQAAKAVACPPPGACTANVVVTVGSDLATS
jgi:hypothetical protein